MANKHEVFDTKHRKPTNDNIRVAVKAPELPDLGEEAPLSDPNMRYTKLPSTTLEMENDNATFNQIKDKTFAAMKLNSRPTPKKRHVRLKHMFDADDDNDNAQRSMMGIGYGGNVPESHHNAPMQHAMHPIIERKHHHKHGHHHQGSHKHHHKEKEHRRASKQPTIMADPNGEKKAKTGSASWVRDLQYGSDGEAKEVPGSPVMSKPPSPEHGAEKSKSPEGVMETSLDLPMLSEPPKQRDADLGLGCRDEVGMPDFSDDVLEVDPRAHEEYNPYMADSTL